MVSLTFNTYSNPIGFVKWKRIFLGGWAIWIVLAALWYFPICLCAVFPRVARKNRTPLNMEYRAAEGWHGQLRKS